jgi:hypothetical protein
MPHAFCSTAVAWVRDGLLLFTDEADNSATQIDTDLTDPAAPGMAVVVGARGCGL